MSANNDPKKKRHGRNDLPDLEAVASATECTGALPFQPPELMPGEDQEEQA